MILKRVMDLLISTFGFFAFLPIIMAISLLIRIKMGAPVIFRQIRPGLFGKPFTLYKFRTMTDYRAENRTVGSDVDRLTPLGKILRSTSLDELPELYNVFIGDLSIVGPRPLLMRYLDHYTPEQMRRHEVKQGLTGWAQIHGRNAITWEEKFKLDLWYVENRSFLLDIKIIIRTVLKVLQREGINQSEGATMKEFLGTENTN